MPILSLNFASDGSGSCQGKSRYEVQLDIIKMSHHEIIKHMIYYDRLKSINLIHINKQ